MKFHLTTLAIATILPASAALAGSIDASAADAPVAVAPIASSFDWTGFYMGAQVGTGHVDAVGSATGPLGGLHAGYMWDLGQTVIGVEATIDATDMSDSTGKVDDMSSLRLRAGYDFDNGVLAYATVGASHSTISSGGVSLDDTGWLAGLGVAYDFGNNWIVGGEAAYHKVDNFGNTGFEVNYKTLTARVSYRF